jgi:hypothetical protein
MAMENLTDFDILLAQEITNLDRFIIKSPIGTNEFWSEWQRKAGEIVITKAAIEKAAKIYGKNLPSNQSLKLNAMLEAYREIISYLELLRETALKLKGAEIDGITLFDSTEGESEESEM